MTSSTRQQLQGVGIVPFIRHLWQTHAPLTLFSLLMAAFTLFFAVGILADSRVITGQPAWLKPAKFAVSITIYTLTITWLLGFIQTERRGLKRVVNAIAWIIIAVFVVEMIPIVLQVLRGTTSHFNVATPLDTFLWSMMGVAIVTLWVTNFVLAGILLFQRFENPAFAWALRLGLMIAIIGMGLGFLMTSPTAQQMASWQAGAPVTVVGAHSVGVPDGGTGLPVTGWSTQGGDLRVPHFIGMHALQVIPLLGWLITRRRRLGIRQQTALVWTASLGFLGLVALVTWQALRAQPLIAPDMLTLTVFAALVTVTLLVALTIMHRGRTRAYLAPTQA
ncbi:MAG: hypothetical protein M3511_11490 [Deinococcota bacterium]|nr:hypothetical protein [Deinococcota bacterium]